MKDDYDFWIAFFVAIFFAVGFVVAAVDRNEFAIENDDLQELNANISNQLTLLAKDACEQGIKTSAVCCACYRPSVVTTITAYSRDDVVEEEYNIIYRKDLLTGNNVEYSFKVRSTDGEFFGRTHLENANVLVIGLNMSEWDAPLMITVNDDVVLDRVIVPRNVDIIANYMYYAYELPVIDRTGLDLEFFLRTDPVNPVSRDGFVYIFEAGYYYEGNELKVGVENSYGDLVSDTVLKYVLDFVDYKEDYVVIE